MFGIGLPEFIILLVVFSISLAPGFIGGWLAGNKGRNRILWFLLCAMLPLLIIVVVFLDPVAEVEGKYRQCQKCMAFVAWDATMCKHCGGAV